MIIITTKRSLTKLISGLMVLVILAVGVFAWMEFKDLDGGIAAMSENAPASFSDNSLSAFLISKSVTSQAHVAVEIFDVSKGMVIKKVDSSKAIQKSASSFLEGITGLYVKVKAIPTSGFIVRIPLEPPVHVKNQWMNGTVKEVFVILPQSEAPYLLMLDDTGKPRFYNFKGDVAPLLKDLDFHAEAAQ